MGYYDYFSGGMTPAHLFAAMTFAFLGWGSYKIVTAAKRNKNSEKSPTTFSLSFWIKDNWVEALKGLLIMFGLVRFASEILYHTIPNSADFLNSKDPMWIYTVVGALKAYLFTIWRNRSKK